MAIRFKLTRDHAERATALLTATLRDLDGTAIPLAALDAVTLTLVDQVSGAVINSRLKQSVLNENGGTVNASGGLTLRLDPNDMVLVDSSKDFEWHTALVEWEWDVAGTTFYGKARIDHKVARMRKAL